MIQIPLKNHEDWKEKGDGPSTKKTYNSFFKARGWRAKL